MAQKNFHRLLAGFIIVVFAVLCTAPVSYARDLVVITENLLPGNYSCATGVCGFAPEIVKEIMARLGVDYKIELMPWKRGFAELSRKPGVALFQTGYTAERADKFLWCGPLGFATFSLFRSKLSNKPVPAFNAAKHLWIGTVADDVREQLLISKGFNKSKFTRTHGNNASIKNLELLLVNRTDLWITTLQEAQETVLSLQAQCKKPKSMSICSKILNIKPGDLLEPIYDIKKIYFYIAFSKGTSLKVVADWQKTLDGMKQDGTYEKIMKKNNYGEMYMTFDKPF